MTVECSLGVVSPPVVSHQFNSIVTLFYGQCCWDRKQWAMVFHHCSIQSHDSIHPHLCLFSENHHMLSKLKASGGQALAYWVVLGKNLLWPEAIKSRFFMLCFDGTPPLPSLPWGVSIPPRVFADYLVQIVSEEGGCTSLSWDCQSPVVALESAKCRAPMMAFSEVVASFHVHLLCSRRRIACSDETQKITILPHNSGVPPTLKKFDSKCNTCSYGEFCFIIPNRWRGIKASSEALHPLLYC